MHNEGIEIESKKAFESDAEGGLLALLEPLLPKVAIALDLDLKLELAVVFFEPLNSRK